MAVASFLCALYGVDERRVYPILTVARARPFSDSEGVRVKQQLFTIVLDTRVFYIILRQMWFFCCCLFLPFFYNPTYKRDGPSTLLPQTRLAQQFKQLFSP